MSDVVKQLSKTIISSSMFKYKVKDSVASGVRTQPASVCILHLHLYVKMEVRLDRLVVVQVAASMHADVTAFALECVPIPYANAHAHRLNLRFLTPPTHMRAHARTSMYTVTFIHACTCTHAHTCARARTHTHTHAQTHACTHGCANARPCPPTGSAVG